MKFVLLTPSQHVASCTAQNVTIDGTMGQFGVLPGHMPMVSLIASGGRVVVCDEDGNVETYIVTDGVAEVTPTSVTVLAQGLGSADSSAA